MKEKRNRYGLNDGTTCSYGGSALMEGVMMKGPDSIAMAVRKGDGEIAIIKKPTDLKGRGKKVRKIPFLRGMYSIFDSMVESVRYLMKSAEFIDLDEDTDPDAEPGKFEKFLNKLFGDKLLDVMLYFSVVIAMLMSVGLFMLLPKFVVELFNISDSQNILKNVIEGSIRIVLFLVYIVLSSKLSDIKRVFSYHGAEHKSIHCYEHGEELTVENVKKYTTLHPRCGTAFMFLIMVISILIYSILDYGLIAIGWNNLAIKIFSRLLFVPLLSGITYEVTRLAAKSPSKIIKLLNAPGLLLQYITTNEPEDEIIEVGIAALKAVIDEEVPYTTEEEEKAMMDEAKNYTKNKNAVNA